MKRRRAVIAYAVLGLFVSRSGARALAEDLNARMERGQTLFMATGCYECHGVHAEGSIDGPRIAPDPPPESLVLKQLREPAARMPIYTPAVLSDADVADILIYLRSIGRPMSADQIPMLNR